VVKISGRPRQSRNTTVRRPCASLTTSDDVAAFPHSGYPDVASYLLSDSMAGDVLTGLVLYPLVLSVVALLVAGLGRGSGASVTIVLR
jgi:hypothetical protein